VGVQWDDLPQAHDWVLVAGEEDYNTATLDRDGVGIASSSTAFVTRTRS
jgi:hypothetical protein